MSSKKIAIIGGGPAGLGAASVLSQHGHAITVYHREQQTGGHLTDWAWLFPGFASAKDVAGAMVGELDSKNVNIKAGCSVTNLNQSSDNQFQLTLNDGEWNEQADAVVYAGGFNVFDATKKEELGYGIYPRVVTSVDLEKILRGDKPFPFSVDGRALRIGVVHCVGSRDEKSGNRHCSRMCCVTGVKQSIELKKHFPNSQITAFYMDMRMFGNGYEELYLEAQRDWQILFVRGRVSEVGESANGLLQVKAEDTLLGRPLRGEFDLLVLLVGMEPAVPAWLKSQVSLECIESGFLNPQGAFTKANQSAVNGLFLAGSCKGPSSVVEAWNDGQACANDVLRYIK